MVSKRKLILVLVFTVLLLIVVSACSPKLTDDEKEGITQIYQVEKAARDVYKYLFDKWGTEILNSISQSEQQHMDIMKELVDKYKLENPVAGNDYGVFSNSDLQTLYVNLINKGSVSAKAALSTAAMIEEFDLVEIQKYFDQTDRDDILKAYERLSLGSDTHLRSFVSQLKAVGVDYQPEYLSKEEFNQSIATKTTTVTSIPKGQTAYYSCFCCGYTEKASTDIPFEDLPPTKVCPVCGCTMDLVVW